MHDGQADANVSMDDRITRELRRTSVATAMWSLLPLSLSIVAGASHHLTEAATYAGVVIVAAFAAALANRPTRRRGVIAAGLLLLASAPFAVRLANEMVFEPVVFSDLPVGHVVVVIFDAMLFVPPLVLAFGVWTRSARISVAQMPQPNSS